MNPDLSVVIPCYNEEACISFLFERLTRVMDSLGRSYELIFINDGSSDATQQKLEACYALRPELVVVLEFNRNYGQSTAIIAGFEAMRGSIAITLDADMQTPPEEIPTVLNAMTRDCDYVGSYRKRREDSKLRDWVSKVSNAMRKKLTRIQILDQGCMLRVYKKTLVDRILSCYEPSLYVSILAQALARNSTEVAIDHHARSAGQTSYSYLALLRLHFDVITGFSVDPLRYITYCGAFFVFLSSLFLSGALLYFFFQKSFSLMHLAVFLLLMIASVAVLSVGIMGEYLGRLYRATQVRPRYILRSSTLQE